eukprot:1188077-Prorocentrum_minimum.AAC.2
MPYARVEPCKPTSTESTDWLPHPEYSLLYSLILLHFTDAICPCRALQTNLTRVYRLAAPPGIFPIIFPIILLHFTGPPVPITARMHSTPRNIPIIFPIMCARDLLPLNLTRVYQARGVNGLIWIRHLRDCDWSVDAVYSY